MGEAVIQVPIWAYDMGENHLSNFLVTKRKLLATAGSEMRTGTYEGTSGKTTNAAWSDNPRGHVLREPPIQQTLTKHPHMPGTFRDFHLESELLSQHLSAARKGSPVSPPGQATALGNTAGGAERWCLTHTRHCHSFYDSNSETHTSFVSFGFFRP